MPKAKVLSGFLKFIDHSFAAMSEAGFDTPAQPPTIETDAEAENGAPREAGDRSILIHLMTFMIFRTGFLVRRQFE
jgi:hypothetical protein